jgi:hypothetical protein
MTMRRATDALSSMSLDQILQLRIRQVLREMGIAP